MSEIYVIMPTMRIKEYYNTHFVDSNKKIPETSLLYRYVDIIQTFFEMNMKDQLLFSFKELDEIKSLLKRENPNDFCRYNTMYACVYFYKQCLKIEAIQLDVRRFNKEHGNNSLYQYFPEQDLQKMIRELNKIRFDFNITDFWTIEDDFKNYLYQDIKKAIDYQSRVCRIDTRDSVEKLKDNTIGCLGIIIALIAVAYNLMN